MMTSNAPIASKLLYGVILKVCCEPGPNNIFPSCIRNLSGVGLLFDTVIFLRSCYIAQPVIILDSIWLRAVAQQPRVHGVTYMVETDFCK